jgi:hypothetical protein
MSTKMAEKVDRVTSNVGGLNQSMGELVETLFAPHPGEKFVLELTGEDARLPEPPKDFKPKEW